MTNEQAIERMKDLIRTCNIGIEKHGEYDDLFKKDKEAIETVLNMQKEKDAEILQRTAEIAEKSAEIERLKEIIAEQCATRLNQSIKLNAKSNEDLEMLNNGWKLELEKKEKEIEGLKNDNKKLDRQVQLYFGQLLRKDKQIDSMASYLASIDFDEHCVEVSGYCLICPARDGDIDGYMSCIKQYFERKCLDE